MPTEARIRPQTPEELEALPEGPAFSLKQYEITVDDRRAGFKMIEGRPYEIKSSAGSINVPIFPDVVAEYVDADQPLAFIDSDGRSWSIGQYRDGSWFKQRK